MFINARIRQARQSMGLSQARLAELLGVTRSACSQWESVKGTVPRRERLEQLAVLLGVSYEWLVTGHQPGAGSPADLVGEGSGSVYRTVLSADEEKLLLLYRALPARKRKAWLEFLQSL